MPKTARHLWDSILSWENLLLAAHDASRFKRCYKAVLFFNSRLEENLLCIRDLLYSEKWWPGQYRVFDVFEPKHRTIHAPCFADRVVHHAIVQVILPYFERRFMDCSFACRKNKGTHAASTWLTHMLRSAQEKWDRFYVLKADISRYFPSIDHEILLGIISRIIGDKKVLALIRRLVTGCSCIENGRGLPLGALTSQLFANAYLDVLDHHIKDKLGVRYYVRYMDDFVILHNDKTVLWKMLADIRDFIACELHLSLNSKTDVFPASHGVDFAGYRHWISHTLPRKRNVRRAARRFKGISRCYAKGRVDLATVRSCMASFVGYMQHCKGWKSAGSALDRLVLVRPSNPDKDE
ncbi:MAG: group II intron reverse transcriptase domain-containing protein [Desulfovibrio sp.]|nr:group II intron reverse transcriptase domain-containing protein [Desulfovibrio sp.]